MKHWPSGCQFGMLPPPQGLLLAVVAELSYCQRAWLLLPASPDLVVQRRHIPRALLEEFTPQPLGKALCLLCSMLSMCQQLWVRSG